MVPWHHHFWRNLLNNLLQIAPLKMQLFRNGTTTFENLTTAMKWVSLLVGTFIKNDSKKIILAQKYTATKKSSILVQSSSNLVKMISQWVGKGATISAKSEQNCRFFISSIFFGQYNFFVSVSTLNYLIVASKR